MGPILAVLAGLLLLCASGIAVGLYVRLAPSAGPTKKTSAQRGNEKTDPQSSGSKPIASDSLDGFTMRGVDAQTILDRMADEGWQFQASSESDVGFGPQTIYTFANAKSDTALLSFRTQPQKTPAIDFSIGYVVHEGGRSLELTVVESSGESKPTLLRLLRKR